MNEPRVKTAALSMGDFEREYMPHAFYLPPCRFHVDFNAILDDPSADLVAVQGPRKFGKTMKGGCSFPLREAVYNPRARLAVFWQTDLDLAAMDLESLKIEIAGRDGSGGNPLLREDFGELKGPRWERYQIDIRKAGCGDGSDYMRIVCGSPQKSVVGIKLHTHPPDLIILMDPQRVRRTTMSDPRQIRAFEDTFEGDLLGSLAPGGRVIFCANPLDVRSLIVKLCRGVGLTGPDGEVYGHTDPDLAAQHAEWTRLRFQTEIVGHPTIQDGTPLWPEGWGKDRIAKRKANCKSHIWAAHHQCSPTDPEGVVFKPTILRNRYGAAPRDRAHAESLWPGIAIAGAIDPAYSRKESADRTAIAIVGRTAEGWFPIISAKGYDNRGYDARADLVLGLHQTWQFDAFGIEETQSKYDFYHYFCKRMQEAGEYFNVIAITRPHNIAKLERIMDMEPAFRNGHLRLAEDAYALAERLETFEASAGKIISPHDDVEDALQTAFEVARDRLYVGAGIAMVGQSDEDGDMGDAEWHRRSPYEDEEV